MPCPIPGMDPYLESPTYWNDFAVSFLTALSKALLPQILPRYDARLEEYHLSNKPEPGIARHSPRTQRRLRIIHLPTERVVTALELLSPANKVPGEGGLDAYLEKRAELLACQCNLVELDLLRGGHRLPMSGPLPTADYYAFIGRVGKKPRCHVLGWHLRSLLPTIPIPLLAPDPDIPWTCKRFFKAPTSRPSTITGSTTTSPSPLRCVKKTEPGPAKQLLWRARRGRIARNEPA
jgi:hypothetical protein